MNEKKIQPHRPLKLYLSGHTASAWRRFAVLNLNDLIRRIKREGLTYYEPGTFYFGESMRLWCKPRHVGKKRWAETLHLLDRYGFNWRDYMHGGFDEPDYSGFEPAGDLEIAIEQINSKLQASAKLMSEATELLIQVMEELGNDAATPVDTG